MQDLVVYQSLWGMQTCNTNVATRPHEEVFAQAAQAKFAGLCLDPGVSQIEEYLALKPFYQQYQMGCLVNVFPNTVEEMRPLLEFSKEMGAPYANVIAPVFPLTVGDAVPIIRTWPYSYLTLFPNCASRLTCHTIASIAR
jgi:sugar phosphate isomerase/epimerase